MSEKTYAWIVVFLYTALGVGVLLKLIEAIRAWKYKRFKQSEKRLVMAETENLESIQRLEAVKKVVEGIKNSFPNAKKINISIDFEFKESSDSDETDELCPVIKIEIEN
jgi:hypothetical protein